jgi:type IV pilus assembly protein PilB
MVADLIENIPSSTNQGVVKLVDRLLLKAIADEASAISIENHQNGTRVRYRRQGQWQMMMPILAGAAAELIGNYLQELAISGSFERYREGCSYKFTLTVWPTVAGDRFNLQISHQRRTAPPLEKLLTNASNLQKVQQMLAGGRGLLLVLANSDSGKSTTIATLLSHQVQESKNIWWLTTAAKYNLDGVSVLEMPKNESKRALMFQSCLAQSPDILAIDRLGDGQTAQALFQIAGERLVIVSMVSDSVGLALNQLLAWGVSVDRLATNLLGVIHQKLLNSICPRCRLADEPSLAEFDRLGLTHQSQGQYYRANRLDFEQCEERQQQHRLCITCYGSGYQGRIGVQSVLPMQAQLKSLLQRQSDSEEIDIFLRECGILSLFDQALPLVTKGFISLAELQKCLLPGRQESYKKAPLTTVGVELSDANTDSQTSMELLALQEKYQKSLEDLLGYQEREETFEQRLRQNRQQAEQSTKIEIALQMISIIDVVELARSSIRPQSDREAAIQKGYTMLENKLISTLRDMGVRLIESQERSFDSRWHEVIEEEISNKPAGQVLEEIKRGFMLGDRVLRLAQVKVAVSSNFP